MQNMRNQKLMRPSFQRRSGVNILKLSISGGSRQSPPASAEVSSTAADNSMQSDELSTPNATIDAEFGKLLYIYLWVLKRGGCNLDE